MKEPFAIYHDEFIREIRRLSRPSPDGIGHPREITVEEGNIAVRVAAQAAAQHMVDYLGFTVDEAREATAELQAIGPGDKEQLKNAWTDFMLRRQRQRRRH